MTIRHLFPHRPGILLLLASVLLLAGVRLAGASVRGFHVGSGTFALNNAGEVLWSNGSLYLWDGTATRQFPPGERGSVEGPWELNDNGQFVWTAQRHLR